MGPLHSMRTLPPPLPQNFQFPEKAVTEWEEPSPSYSEQISHVIFSLLSLQILLTPGKYGN